STRCSSPARRLLLPLYPYTTLFQSRRCWPAGSGHAARAGAASVGPSRIGDRLAGRHAARQTAVEHGECRQPDHQPPERPADPERSEEHTSELQSRENLVCRLLLEKK